MSEYVPFQHVAKPIGYEHETIFATLELWADEPPDTIRIGRLVYMLVCEEEDEDG